MCVYCSVVVSGCFHGYLCEVSRERIVLNDVRPQHLAFQHHPCWTARQQIDGTGSALQGVCRLPHTWAEST